MSYSEIEESLKSLEPIDIRGRLNIEQLVQRQIDRCNMSIGSEDPSLFESYVRGLMYMLPDHKYIEIDNNSNKYNSEPEELSFQYCGNIPMGTKNNPLVTYFKYPQYDFLKDHPLWMDLEEDVDYEIISPTVIKNPMTDYEKLYKMLLVAFQEGGLTWKIESTVAHFGKVVKSNVPKKMVNTVTKAVVSILIQGRTDEPEIYNGVNYSMIVEEIRNKVPQTPIIIPNRKLNK